MILVPAVVLGALALAGCSDSTHSATGSSSSAAGSSSPVAGASPATGDPSASSRADDPAAATDPGTTPSSGAGTTGSGGAGHGAAVPKPVAKAQDRLTNVDWARQIKSCPFPNQRMRVNMIVKGDVNGDGTPDTLVVDSCDASTSYWQSTVEVFDGTSTPSATRRMGILLTEQVDDQPVAQHVAVSGGIITITGIGTGIHATKACPDLDLTYRYRWTDGAFRLVARTAQQRSTCGRVS